MLEQSQIDDFLNIGYFVIDDVFLSDEVKEVKGCVERLEQRFLDFLSHPEILGKSGIEEVLEVLRESALYKGSKFYADRERGIQIKRVNWCGASEPALMSYSRDPRITGIVSQLLESDEADHLVNQVHFKLPNDGVFYKMHQDSEYRRVGTELWEDKNWRGSYVNVITAIDPMTAENGAVRIVPGNPRKHLGLEKNVAERQRYSEFAKPVSVDASGILVLRVYTIHGSYANTSDTPRRVLLNGYGFPEANKRKFTIPGAGERVSLTSK